MPQSFRLCHRRWYVLLGFHRQPERVRKRTFLVCTLFRTSASWPSQVQCGTCSPRLQVCVRNSRCSPAVAPHFRLCLVCPVLLGCVRLRTLPPLAASCCHLRCRQKRFLVSIKSLGAEHGGTRLQSQQSEGRGRRISGIGASLGYIKSPRTASATERPCLKSTKQNDNKVTLGLDTPVIMCVSYSLCHRNPPQSPLTSVPHMSGQT